MKTRVRASVFLLIMFMVGLSEHPVWPADPTGTGAALEAEAEAPGAQSLTEVNKQLTNPVSSFWSLAIQQNNYLLDNPNRYSPNLQFQPVLPVSLTSDWNLLTRPVIPLFVSQPHPVVAGSPPRMGSETTTGFGDMILLEMLSPGPSIAGNWLLGVGPTFIFPTASTDFTGAGKWQAGPSAVVGYLSSKWILGAFVQNWTSFAGDSSRPSANQMNLQPIAAYFFGEGWSIGYSGNILANWTADSHNVWTVPLGLGVNKVVKFGKLPIRVGIAGQYMPIHPDSFGQQWNIQLSFTPVIPKLIKGNVFGE
ncbi:MAG: transporter [Syntrophobacteraceae bacterium]|jgi:hypothetical protein